MVPTVLVGSGNEISLFIHFCNLPSVFFENICAHFIYIGRGGGCDAIEFQYEFLWRGCEVYKY